jgi:hypothetical protein
LLLSEILRDDVGPARPFEDYQRMFLSEFDVSPERAWLFSQLMRNYDDEIEDLRQTALENSMAELGPELNRLGLRYRDQIRNHVLPEDQRGDFDRLALASAWPTPDVQNP